MIHSVLLTSVALVGLVAAQHGSYVPTLVACPSNNLITRTGSPLLGTQKLDVNESAYITERRQNVLPPLWGAYLSNGTNGDTGYNLSAIVGNASNYPRLGTAVSGGGLRASLYGAGTLSALDSRNATSLGGLLQLSDYLSGLSGGSWTVTSLMLNDFPDLYSLVLGSTTQTSWLLDLDILAPAGVFGLGNNRAYYDDILNDVRAKADAGWPVSIVDVWGRALARHFFNETNRDNFYSDGPHDNGLLWSSIKYTQNFQARSVPLPLVVTTSRVSEEMQDRQVGHTTVIPLSNTQFEFTPYTFGSFDPMLQATVPVEFAGSYLSNGAPLNSTACAAGYENAGFVIGSSAALFNAAEEAFAGSSFIDLLQTLSTDLLDIEDANYSVPLVANWPNSFMNLAPVDGVTFESTGNDILQITDGGENGENVPLSPLFAKARELDIILAIDASADTTFSWPNGTSLLATRDRVKLMNFSSFPPIPDTTEQFVNEGLNLRPTFFGCNTTGNGNMSELANYPILVYMPNAPPATITTTTYFTNTSTYKLSYSQEDQVAFLDAAQANGLKGFQTEGETDPEWPLCLKCAVVDRARKRANVPRSDACRACMNKYCWSADSTQETLPTVSTTPAAASSTGAACHLSVERNLLAGLVGAAVAVGAML